MNIPQQIARQVREIHFGGNWTDSNLKEHLADVTWQQATTKIYALNTIATLVYHINYFISAVLKVLEGEPLHASDKFSFDHPPIRNQNDWDKFLEKIWADAEKMADLIENLPESKLGETFIDEKYGTYFKNFQGIIEHTHYHLGQIVLIKKILSRADKI